MSDLSQFGIDAGPPPASASGPTFIGPSGYQLPADYPAPNDPGQEIGNLFTNIFNPDSSHTVRSLGPTAPPRYKQGDEFLPLSQSWSPTRIASLQRQLVDIGLLKPNDFQLGFWDRESMNAFREVLGYANVSGRPYDQTLADFRNTISQFGDSTLTKGRARTPFVSELADPEALRDTLQNVAVRSMGRPVTPDEEAKFIESFRAMQEGAQRQAYDLKGDIDLATGLPSGPGGSVTIPDAQSQARKSLIETHGGDIASYDSFQKYKGFLSLIQGV